MSSALEPIRIYDFNPEDSRAVVDMWRASFEFGVGIKDPHPIEDQAAYLEERILPLNRVRVAWEGSTIVGFLASSQESIAQLYVRVENIGQGIGTQFVNLAKAESSGSLWLYTFAQNTRGCRFYERHGFVEVDRGFEPTWQLPDVKYRWRAPTE